MKPRSFTTPVAAENRKVSMAELYRFKRLTGGWKTDPTPGPYPGSGPIRWRRYETPEQRAYRRYPVNAHKPRFE